MRGNRAATSKGAVFAMRCIFTSLFLVEVCACHRARQDRLVAGHAASQYSCRVRFVRFDVGERVSSLRCRSSSRSALRTSNAAPYTLVLRRHGLSRHNPAPPGQSSALPRHATCIPARHCGDSGRPRELLSEIFWELRGTVHPGRISAGQVKEVGKPQAVVVECALASAGLLSNPRSRPAPPAGSEVRRAADRTTSRPAARALGSIDAEPS